MMRDYDGSGGAFGETSVSATSADTAKLTVYAAVRAADSALTILVVNSTSTAYTSVVSLANVTDTQPVPTYRYDVTNPAGIVAEPSVPAGQSLTVTFAPQSLTMLVVPSGSTPLERKAASVPR
jgi:hypothetical protein